MDKKEVRSSLLSIWMIQDALLQSYRSLYLTANSILLGGGIALLVVALGSNIDKAIKILFLSMDIILALVAFYLINQWIKVTDKRGNDVTFIQNQLMCCEMKGKVFNRDNQNDNGGLIDIAPVNDIPIVTTFKFFENTTAEEQKQINENYFKDMRDKLPDNKTIDTATRKTLQVLFPWIWRILWTIFLLAFGLTLITGVFKPKPETQGDSKLPKHHASFSSVKTSCCICPFSSKHRKSACSTRPAGGKGCPDLR